ncbi:helix-turn-helix transcriptional regulator, partial [Pseudomonas sp. GW456-L14]
APQRAAHLLANVQNMLTQQQRLAEPLLGRIALHRGRWSLCQGLDTQAVACFEAGLSICMRNHDKRVLYGFLGLAQVAANQR